MYVHLKHLKGPGDSFSDLFNKILTKRNNYEFAVAM